MINQIQIAICGLGSAGKARLKALNESSFFKLAGVVSRHSDISSLNWDKTLKNTSIQAVAISTENTRHEQLTKEALQANKHVLCDYPLCFSQKEAEELYKMAHERKLILHTEHMGLLTQEHQWVKNQIKNLGKLKNGEFLFQGQWNEKLAQDSYLGPAPFLAISRLVQVADWFGEFDIEVLKYKKNEKEFLLNLMLHLKTGGDIFFTEHRAFNQKRGRTFKATFEKGNLAWPENLESKGLFLADLKNFHDQIMNQASCYYYPQLMISVIGQLEKITNQAG